MTAPVPVEDVLLDTGPVALSGLLARAADPEALVVALHGGAARASYFHSRAAPGSSLLEIGAASGFTVLALDRPGYGASAGRADVTTAEQRAELIGSAIGRAGAMLAADTGAGTVLVAHSMGCLPAIRIAAEHRCDDLLGVEVCGIGLRRNEQTARMVDSRAREGGAGYRAALRDAIWGPAQLYPDAAIEAGTRTVAVPSYEAGELAAWAHDFPKLAAAVDVPVHYTLAEDERWWTAAPDGIDQVTGLFVNAPRVAASVQIGSGHNVSLGWLARAYHLRVLAFAYECVAPRIDLASASARGY